jgi:hypothetical protein
VLSLPVGETGPSHSSPSPVQRKKPGTNGAFITGCHEHCGQWAQGQMAGSDSDFNATIDGACVPCMEPAR